MISVPVINKSRFPLPEYATAGASGLDIRANLEASLLLKPLERLAIPTGLFMAIPEGYEAQIRPRSGLALKKGITCLNTPGTIDADYRGELKVILINLSPETQEIQPGERIAQLVLQEVSRLAWVAVEQLDTTDRNAGGFGHTGSH